MSVYDRIKQLEGDVARLRAVLLLLLKRDSPEPVTREEVEHLQALRDMLLEDETSFQESIMAADTEEREPDAANELFESLTEEQQRRYLEEASPLDTPEEAIERMRRIKRDSDSTVPTKTPMVRPIVIPDFVDDVVRNATVHNLEESLRSVLGRFENTQLTPTTLANIHQATLSLLNHISHQIQVGPEFWYVDLTPEVDQGRVTATVLPQVLRNKNLDVLEEDDGHWKATLDMGDDKPLMIVGGSFFEVLIGMAKLVEARNWHDAGDTHAGHA